MVCWCGPCTICQNAAQIGSMDQAFSPFFPKVKPITVQPISEDSGADSGTDSD